MEGSQWGVVAHLDDRARALDEAAADEEGELEVLDPPAADRGSCPLSDHPRGITSEAVQLARGLEPKPNRVSRPPRGPSSRCDSRRP